MSNDGGSGVKRLGLILFVALFTVVFTESCKDGLKEGAQKKFESADYIDAEAFAEQLGSMLAPADSAAAMRIGDISNNLRLTYQVTGNAPVWITGKGISKAADSFIAELDDIYMDGINPERYGLLSLKSEISKLKAEKSPELSRLIAFDTTMTHTYLTVAKDLLVGLVKIRKADSLWYNSNDSTWDAPMRLASQVGMNDSFLALNSFRSKLPAYHLLREECRHFTALQKDSALLAALAQLREVKNTRELDSAQSASLALAIRRMLPSVKTDPADSLGEQVQLVKAFQDYAHVKPTGKLDTSTLKKLYRDPAEIVGILRANMERLRWLKQDLPETYVLVNIPLAELFFYRDGKEIMHMNTVVGKPSRQTPAFNADMTNVVINPPWGVPPTILKKDVGPGIGRSGEAYLRKKGLQAFDRKGNRIDGSTITLANYKRYSYRQPPGAHNALGYVKFNLPNKWDIYLHDTPHREDFPGRYRAKSSGCVRIEKPKEMALYILSQIEGKDFTEEKLDKVISTHKTSWQVLKNRIPVHFTYLTAYANLDNTGVRLADDVYKRDAKLIALLNQDL